MKQLLTNSNFWAALAALAGAICAACGMDSGSVQQLTTIISSAAVLVAVIIGQSVKQAATIKANATLESAKIGKG